ncbi:MAG TPA: hypothetical protein VI749_05990 [Candidatus Omnitrophota bacterium]|nr:hypothetical protein [Candidatus Omnitrophota bacterium]
MNKNNLSRRGFLKLLGIYLVGFFAILWQNINGIFSPKNTQPSLKEAKHYSRSDEMAG